MASSPSIASTRSIAPAAASARPGPFARMLRAWLEQKSRIAGFGILPL